MSDAAAYIIYTLVYSEPWHIQNLRQIQNPARVMTVCAI